MLGAMSLIKISVLAALVLTVVTLWLKLDAEQVRNKALAEKLNVAADVNKANRAIIQALATDNADANKLLVARQQEYSRREAKLNADIKLLKSELKAVDCYRLPWPRSVSMRLRQPY